MKRQLHGPDDVEAWCVALSACFIYFVQSGLGRMSGILYVAFIDAFQVDRLQASLPFSTRALTRSLLGPLAGIFGQKYGVRTTCVLGGIVASITAFACFFASNILWMTVLWGILNGAGAAFSVSIINVILGQHFKKHIATATGIVYSGGYVGSFIFPALLEYLLHAYGMGGTFFIIAGITMNVIPAAMILRKPSWLKNKRDMNTEILTVFEESRSSKSDKTAIKQCYRKYSIDYNNHNELHSNGNYEVFSDNTRNSSLKRTEIKSLIDTSFLRENNERVTHLLTIFESKWNWSDTLCSCSYAEKLSKQLESIYGMVDEILIPQNGVQANAPIHSCRPGKGFKIFDSNHHFTHCGFSQTNAEQVVQEDNSSPDISIESIMLLVQKIITEDRNGILRSFQQSEQDDVLKIIEEFQQICALFKEKETYFNELIPDLENKNNAGHEREELSKQTEMGNTFTENVKSAVRLHTNPIFLLIILSRSVHFLIYIPTLTIIVDFAMDKGLLEEDGKYIFAAMSFGDLIGGLCLGWVTDNEYLTLPRFMVTAMVLHGACTASISLMYSREALLSILAVYGMLQASSYARHPVLVTKYLGKGKLSVAMGCLDFFSGLLGFALPNYIGYFRDTIGSYNYIFFINGAIGFFVGIMWLFEPLLAKCRKSNEGQIHK